MNAYCELMLFIIVILFLLLTAFVRAWIENWWLEVDKKLKPEDFKVKKATGEGREGCWFLMNEDKINCAQDEGGKFTDSLFGKTEGSISCHNKIAKLKLRSIWK